MNKLKLYRLDRGLTQVELSALSSVPRYIISLTEAAIKLPTTSEIKRLATALGVRETDLFRSTEETHE